MSSNAENENFQELKNRLFRRWHPLPSIYSQWEEAAHWSNKQPRSPAPLRICKCRDHVKTVSEVASNKSKSLPEVVQDVTENINSEVVNVEDVSEIETVKTRLRL
ncbi:hypothetical protein Ddc_17315 [Ditylenchus destructor]|nr:hypothetical protein Ddc_17315 [Ditylenchus destructor]